MHSKYLGLLQGWLVITMVSVLFPLVETLLADV